MVHGDKRASGEVLLRADPGNFTQGKTDVFRVDLPDMGTSLEKLIVGHKEDGSDPKWHLESMMIKNASCPTDPPTLFMCGEWHGRKEGRN